jgi:hypothetical protein
MHAVEVDVPAPSPASAAVSVEYSLVFVPDPHTVKRPLGVLVREALFWSPMLGNAAVSPMNVRRPSAKKQR